MIILHSDLDNTLIYSYKHDIGRRKKCVEIYQDREVSFMTEKSYDLLKSVNDKVVFVPTTTRTVEQYGRIDLGIGNIEYALVCNGGVLLVNGREDEAWYRESVRLTADCREELDKAQEILEGDIHRNFEIRNIRQLFLFTKSDAPEKSAESLVKMLDMERVDVMCNGVKVYVVPKKLSKGTALKRFREKVHGEKVIAAGDSEFDISMLREADVALAPAELADIYFINEDVIRMGENAVFSDNMLEYIEILSHNI